MAHNPSVFDGESYSQFRPQHNTMFFAHVLKTACVSPGAIIADIGAGNGNSTLPLLALGYKVIAIEGEASMLAQLRRAVSGHPDVHIIAKKLEAVTASDMDEAMAALGSAPESRPPVAFAASALHWFDRARALPKLRHEVIKPGGRLVGISRLLDASHPSVKELHALLLQYTPGYGQAETQFSAKRWSNIEKQAPRYMRDGYVTETLHEQRTFADFDEFKGYLQTVSSLKDWLRDLPEESPAMHGLREYYTRYAQGNGLTLPWMYIACVGEVETKTLPDPFPPPAHEAA